MKIFFLYLIWRNQNHKIRIIVISLNESKSKSHQHQNIIQRNQNQTVIAFKSHFLNNLSRQININLRLNFEFFRVFLLLISQVRSSISHILDAFSIEISYATRWKFICYVILFELILDVIGPNPLTIAWKRTPSKVITPNKKLCSPLSVILYPAITEP